MGLSSIAEEALPPISNGVCTPIKNSGAYVDYLITWSFNRPGTSMPGDIVVSGYIDNDEGIYDQSYSMDAKEGSFKAMNVYNHKDSIGYGKNPAACKIILDVGYILNCAV